MRVKKFVSLLAFCREHWHTTFPNEKINFCKRTVKTSSKALILKHIFQHKLISITKKFSEGAA